MLLDTIQTMLSYDRAFDEEYVVHIVLVCTMHIVVDVIFSTLQTSNYRETDIRCITVDEMMIKHKGVSLLLISVGMDASTANIMSKPNLDDPNLYILSEESIFLLSKASGAFVKSDFKSDPIHENVSYKHTKRLFDNLHACHL